ncbi:hypothetical protein [Actinomadura sp. DC4]|uniref:hypothetical protein n=1 Tax=Actinomadura sp. DC4 TaxID=3055069 RepID=UPI0025B27045|nr:hypothetical protein [Actinomadura sp. DC4]MDN3357345.1 hypothetical protein [Actinomadura sp. DC4]
MVQRSLPMRLVDGRICAYDIAPGSWGTLSPAAVFRPSEEVVDHAVSADLRRAVYTTVNAAVCMTDDGTEIWRSAFEPPATERHGHHPGCALSLDDRLVWIYRPDSMAGRKRLDQWVVLDAETGRTIDHADLETVGHGAEQLRHPAGESLLLNVGEGQDGSIIFRGTPAGDRLDLVRYPWSDRCLIDLAPDGDRFMTVDHDQGDVAFHTYPGGEVELKIPIETFGYDPEDAFVEWSGGYLRPDTAIVTIVGETEDEQEWWHHYPVDLRSGQVGAEFDAHGKSPYDLEPLGDGSWLTTDASGHPTRWSDLRSAR